MVTKEDAKIIRDMYLDGHSSIYIGKVTGRCSSGVRLILRKSGTPLRTKSYANKISEFVKRDIDHPNWKGGFTFHKGQVYRNLNHKRVKESHYQWCVSNGLGCVPKGMIIHHIDCNPKNNNPDNLLLLDQGTHVKIHRLIDDVRMLKILNRGD